LHRAKIAHKECEWKDGDRGGLAEQQDMEQIMERGKKLLQEKTNQLLTGIGLLMEGLSNLLVRVYLYWLTD
jgi:hypothetical protein